SSESVLEALLHLSTGILSAESLRALIKLLPEEEEDRLVALLLKEEFSPTLTLIKEDLSIILNAIKELLSCSELHRVLRLVLQAANIISAGGSAGNALGFKLSSLLSLVDTKSNKPGINLMHVLAEEAQKNHLLMFTERLSHVQQAERVSVEGLSAEFISLSDRIHQLQMKIQTDQELFTKLQPFLESASGALKDLSLSVDQLQIDRDALIDFFCEERDSFSLDECLRIFRSFSCKFRKALQDNVERGMWEDSRRRRLKEAELKRKTWAGLVDTVGGASQTRLKRDGAADTALQEEEVVEYPNPAPHVTKDFREQAMDLKSDDVGEFSSHSQRDRPVYDGTKVMLRQSIASECDVVIEDLARKESNELQASGWTKNSQNPNDFLSKNNCEAIPKNKVIEKDTMQQKTELKTNQDVHVTLNECESQPHNTTDNLKKEKEVNQQKNGAPTQSAINDVPKVVPSENKTKNGDNPSFGPHSHTKDSIAENKALGDENIFQSLVMNPNETESSKATDKKQQKAEVQTQGGAQLIQSLSTSQTNLQPFKESLKLDLFSKNQAIDQKMKQKTKLQTISKVTAADVSKCLYMKSDERALKKGIRARPKLPSKPLKESLDSDIIPKDDARKQPITRNLTMKATQPSAIKKQASFDVKSQRSPSSSLRCTKESRGHPLRIQVCCSGGLPALQNSSTHPLACASRSAVGKGNQTPAPKAMVKVVVPPAEQVRKSISAAQEKFMDRRSDKSSKPTRKKNNND
ncbi:hypothetical protein DNTS_018610, partial [Danionella cerebrum]